MVVTFRAYSKDQILRVLQERLSELPYTVFQHQALERCARSAIEILEAEIRESTSISEISLEEKGSPEQIIATAPSYLKKQELDIVMIDHMDLALSKTYRSPVVETTQSLPHHQQCLQIVLCSSMKHCWGMKKDTILGEVCLVAIIYY